jgi:hypothetical protein
MDRIRGPFVASIKPAYDDPDNVATYPTGYFEKDPQEPPTQITADWANGVQGELTNLITALGMTPATDEDDQLAIAFAKGTFIPIFVDSVGFSPMVALGQYARLGGIAMVEATMSWDPSNAAVATTPVKIKLPYQPTINSIGDEGPVSLYSEFGAQGSSFGMAGATILGGDASDAHIRITGRGATWATSKIELQYGPTTDTFRSVIFQIAYHTNGVFQY